jgi:hypothetical protein
MPSKYAKFGNSGPFRAYFHIKNNFFYNPSMLLAHGWWFSPGTPASSTTKTGRHDIAEILLKVALNNKNQSINQSINH